MSHFTSVIEDPDGLKRITYRDKRFYRATDTTAEVWVPSVTTYLEAWPKSRHYYEWLKRYGDATDTISMEALEKGSKVHEATETLEKTGKLRLVNEDGNSIYSLDEIFMIHRYKDFRDRYCSEPPAIIEGAYASSVLGEGGTVDRVWRLNNGEVWLIDLKTGNMYDYYFLQLYAYKRLFEYFNPNTKINKVGILWLNAKTRTDKDWQGKGWQMVVPDKSEDHYLRLYEGTKANWQEENMSTKPRNFDFNTEISIEIRA